jgi:hypothetical protein
MRDQNFVGLLKFGDEQAIKRVVEKDLAILSLVAVTHACVLPSRSS